MRDWKTFLIPPEKRKAVNYGIGKKKPFSHISIGQRRMQSPSFILELLQFSSEVVFEKVFKGFAFLFAKRGLLLHSLSSSPSKLRRSFRQSNAKYSIDGYHSYVPLRRKQKCSQGRIQDRLSHLTETTFPVMFFFIPVHRCPRVCWTEH